MYRLLALAIAAGTALAATTAVAAPERVRGTVAAVSGDTLTVRTDLGQNVPVMLTDKTHYLKVAPSSLDHVDRGAYIGTATKSIGDQLIASIERRLAAALRVQRAGGSPAAASTGSSG